MNVRQLVNVYICKTSDNHHYESDLFKRYILNRETGLTNIQLDYGSYGKPFLKVPGWTNVQFNISHSGSYLVGVVAFDVYLGIDIEYISPIDFDCIEYFMNEKEIVQFNNLRSEEAKLHYFYTIWTLKEAYSKMIGMGLSMNLTEVSFAQKNQQFTSSFAKLFCETMIVDHFYRLSLVSSKKVEINLVTIHSNVLD